MTSGFARWTRRTRRSVMLALLGVACVWSLTAQAAERIALFPFEGFSLPKPVEMAPLGLGKKVSDALTSAGHEVITPVLLLRDMMIAVDCKKFDGRCVALIGRNLEVTHVVVGKLTIVGDQVWVQIRKWRVAAGVVEHDVDELFPATVLGLTAGFAPLAARLVESPGAGPPVDSDPDAIGAGAIKPHRMGFERLSMPGLVAAASGGVVLVVAAITGASAGAARRDLDDASLTYSSDFEAAVLIGNRGRAFARATGALLGVGLMAVAAGATLVVLRLGKKERSTTLSFGVGGDGARVLLRVPLAGGDL